MRESWTAPRGVRHRWRVLPVWALLTGVLAGCVSTIEGDILLDPVSVPVQSYLGQQGDVSFAGRVDAYALGGGVSVGNTLADSTNHSPPDLAGYEWDLLIAEGSTAQYRLRVTGLRFQGDLTDLGGAGYSFGPLRASAPDQHETPIVGAGETVTADIIECPALATVTVSLVGVSDDLDQLDDPAVVAVVALVREDPALPDFVPQAFSAVKPVFLSDLLGSGVDVEVMFRSGREVRFAAMVGATSDDPGFPAVPDEIAGVSFPFTLPTELVQFSGIEPPGSRTPACGDAIGNIPVDVTAERLAGSVTGLLDVVGKDEEVIKVFVGSLAYDDTRDIVPPAPGPHTFTIGGIPEGTYDVEARVLTDDKRLIVVFPYQKVTVVRPGVTDLGETVSGVTDLGATFISPFHVLNVPVRLIDPGPDSALQFIQKEPFQFTTSLRGTTAVSARGHDSEVTIGGVIVGLDPNKGASRAVVSGDFNIETGEAPLTATLGLVGLGDPNSAADGSGAREVFYKFRNLNLLLDDQASIDEEIEVTRTTANTGSLPFLAALHGSDENRESALEPLAMCFGETVFNMATNSPGYGLFDPRLRVVDSTPIATFDPAENDGRAVDYRVDTSFRYGIGGHIDELEAAPTAALRASLPAFLDYDTSLKVKIKNLGSGGISEFSLPDNIPISALRCGERRNRCLQIDPLTGELIGEVTARINSSTAVCDAVTEVGVDFEVASTGAPVDEVTIQFGDDGEEVTICSAAGGTPCGSEISGTQDFVDIAAGQHWVTLRALVEGCPPVEDRVRINVNASPTLVCLPPPADGEELTIISPDGNEISYDDVAALIGDGAFSADWQGGCFGQQRSLIQSSYPQIFPISNGVPTEVRFFTDPGPLPGAGQSCTWRINVEPPDGCSTLTNLPVGPLEDGDLRVGHVVYRPLNSDGLWRTTDFYPPGAADDESELAVSTGIEVELPFPAQRMLIRFVKPNPAEMVVVGFNADGAETGMAEFAGENRNDTIREFFWNSTTRLHISGGGNEIFLFDVCYAHSLQAGYLPFN